ncbi:hypothetical protein R84B8_02319 [Treponema sp. R8-4-B8]
MVIRGGLNSEIVIHFNKTSTYGGGVYVAEGGTFTMYGGQIVYNSASSGGGVYNLGTFNMYGGGIHDNFNTSNGGGVYNEGTFNMKGGNIYENTVSINGGGVYNEGTFIMDDGKIYENKTTGTGSITNTYGGGVYISANGSFTMNSGEIYSNETTKGGGGVYVSSLGTFIMQGGSIYSNKTKGDNSFGGGVCLNEWANFSKTNGIIYGGTGIKPNMVVNSNNTTINNKGNAVCIIDSNMAVIIYKDSDSDENDILSYDNENGATPSAAWISSP